MLPRRLPALALLLLAGVVPAQEPAEAPGSPAPPAPEPGSLTVRALANEGFLLSAGEVSVAVDAFVVEPAHGYGFLAGALRVDLEAARGPFAGLELALASHRHEDHFQGAAAQRFLAASPATLLVSSPQVVDALWAADTPAREGIRAESVRAVLPEPGEEETLEHGGVRVTFLRLSHGTGRFAAIENLGHLVTVNGVTALHVGDAATDEAVFAPYALAERGIDVVFVPYWYLRAAEGRAIVERHFRPAVLILCHVPPGELEAVAREVAALEDAHLLREPLDELVVLDRR